MLLLFSLVTLCVYGLPGKEQLEGPKTPLQWKDWLAGIKVDRQNTLREINYTGAVYSTPQLKWTQKAYMQPQMMVHDLFFFDYETETYTVDKYLNDLETRYGGIDAVLVWATYPNMGIDDRNQYDMVRCLPGGKEGFSAAVKAFQDRGVSVLLPYNPWDNGTRPEKTSDAETLAQLLPSLGVQGFNGDTMYGIGEEFFQDSKKNGHPLALQPELALPAEQMNWITMSWGYWSYPWVPSVDRYKWYDSRHMTNVCYRWQYNRTDVLQFAFFNGDGYETWENVWGIWVPITPRYGETIRRIATILRQFSDHFVNGEWEPHTPTVQNTKVYSSKFTLNDTSVWVFVNRAKQNLTAGPQIQLEHFSSATTHCYDTYHGSLITPSVSGGLATFSFPIEAHGFGSLFCAPRNSTLPTNFYNFLTRMNNMTRRALESYPNDHSTLNQTIQDNPKTPRSSTPPEDMVRIPGKKNYVFHAVGREIEGTVDIQYPWENSPDSKNHTHVMSIDSFFIDKYPVTNKKYKEFLMATRYQPKDTLNYLRDWKDGNYRPGWENKPVTWLGIKDMAAYAKWAQKRLPDEWEWQYVAENGGTTVYPWGNEFAPTNIPATSTNRIAPEPSNVTAHPSGVSQWGVWDLLGNVWQLTNIYSDTHTRFAVLKGGSPYLPQVIDPTKNQDWYFPNPSPPVVNMHGKYLLMGDSYNRAGTLGFRCVKDISA